MTTPDRIDSAPESDSGPLEVTPIGRIRTPFPRPAGTPIQPTFARGARGVVELDEPYRPALADLAGFERLWLIYWFHEAGPWSPRIVPFRDTVERGLFATRAPRRPNPFGISVVRLVAVEADRLVVEDVDVIDGTPLLDIKPYVPRFDAFPDSRAGWLDEDRADRERADERFEG